MSEQKPASEASEAFTAFGSINKGLTGTGTNLLEKLDIEEVASDLTLVIQKALAGLLEGATEDVEAFLMVIGQDMTMALAIGDEKKREALLDELLNQTAMVAELNRVRLVNTTNKVLRQILDTVASSALVGLKAAIKIIV